MLIYMQIMSCYPFQSVFLLVLWYLDEYMFFVFNSIGFFVSLFSFSFELCSSVMLGLRMGNRGVELHRLPLRRY